MAFEITDSTFQAEVLDSDKVSLVDFWAAWCGPCRMVGPIIDELADEYKDKAVIGKIDVDANQDVPMKYGVRSIPTLLFIKNGEVVDKIVGAAPKSTIEEKLNQYI